MAGEEGSGAEDASSMNAHRLVQYFFLDVASALESQQGANNAGPTWADVNGVDPLRCGSKWSELISESLIKFPSAFGVPPSVIKLTQAFWLLDHREFEDAMAMLLDPLVVPADITLGMLSLSTTFLKPGFFGHLKKNSRPKKLQLIFEKNSSKSLNNSIIAN